RHQAAELPDAATTPPGVPASRADGKGRSQHGTGGLGSLAPDAHHVEDDDHLPAGAADTHGQTAGIRWLDLEGLWSDLRQRRLAFGRLARRWRVRRRTRRRSLIGRAG